LAWKISRILWWMEKQSHIKGWMWLYCQVFWLAEKVYPYPKHYVRTEDVGLNALELEGEWGYIESGSYIEYEGCLTVYNRKFVQNEGEE